MKMNKLTKTAMLALLAVSFAAVSASAQNVPAGPDDLILGFQVTDGAGQGGTSNLEVDLGDISLYTPVTSYTLSQLAVADLVSTYGSNWATRSDLSWGVAGVSSVGTNQFALTYSGSSAPSDSSAQAVPYGAIGALPGGLNTTAHTANSTSSAVLPTSQGNSYTGELTDGGTTSADFQFFSQTDITDVNGGAGAVGSVDLYTFNQGTGRTQPPATLDGVFSLSSDGTLSFNAAAAVPEPSAYALGICAVLLFIVLKRRQSVS
jgi:hypothetical protein